MEDQRMRPDDSAPARRSETSDGIDQGLRVLSYLISGILVYGALGWVGDHFLGTHFLLPIGIVLGAALAIYTSIRRLLATATADSSATTTTTTIRSAPTRQREREDVA